MKNCETKALLYIAHKSGTLNVFYDKTIVEAVKKDLWNLVTLQDVDVSIKFDSEMNITDIHGNVNFFEVKEINELLSNVKKIRHIFREDLLEGKSILLEWSYASNCNTNNEVVDEQYLVFYEARTI